MDFQEDPWISLLVPGEFALWKAFVVATEWLSPEISRGHGLLGSDQALSIPSLTPKISLW